MAKDIIKMEEETITKLKNRTERNQYLIAMLEYGLGIIICYLGGLYGGFEKNLTMMIAGIVLKFLAVYLMLELLLGIRKENGKKR